jgi:hypothetical protein
MQTGDYLLTLIRLQPLHAAPALAPNLLEDVLRRIHGHMATAGRYRADEFHAVSVTDCTFAQE